MKSEVYSWRGSPDLKSSLEREARLPKASVSMVLEVAARGWLTSDGDGDGRAVGDAEIQEIHGLMCGYWDRRLDFADATLVYLAKRESLSTVFTVDFGDFETYRIHGRRRFRVLPDRSR